MNSDIDALKVGIKELDKSVAEATAQRKEEHSAYLTSTAANNAAVDLLKMAENRLNKFYNPDSYKAPPKDDELLQQPSSEDSQEGSGGIFFAQVRARVRKENSGGVFAMLAQISKDVEVSMTEEKKQRG